MEKGARFWWCSDTDMFPIKEANAIWELPHVVEPPLYPSPVLKSRWLHVSRLKDKPNGVTGVLDNF